MFDSSKLLALGITDVSIVYNKYKIHIRSYNKWLFLVQIF